MYSGKYTTIVLSPAENFNMAFQETVSSLVIRGASLAEKNRQSPAIYTPDNKLPLTYDQLISQIELVKAALNQMGYNKDSRFAIVLPNGAVQCTATVSICSNFIAAPLSSDYTPEEFSSYYSGMQINALIVNKDDESPAVIAAKEKGVQVIYVIPNQNKEPGCFSLEGENISNPVISLPPNPEDVCFLLHTSGTTSHPKIVPLTQSNIVAAAENGINGFNLTTQDKCLNLMPLVHISSAVIVMGTLGSGGNLFCTPKFSTSKFFEWLEKSQATWFSGTTTMHHNILSQATRLNGENVNGLAPNNKLRFVRTSAMPISADTMIRMREFYPNASIINTFSMSEAANILCSPFNTDGGDISMLPVSGPNSIKVIDEAGNIITDGTEGQLYVKGPVVFGGYEVGNGNGFLDTNDFTSDGWFRTGDLVRLNSEGKIIVTGRVKETIIVGGGNIHPQEVDQILLTHPDIQDVVTFPLKNSKYGETVAAAIVLRPEVNLNDEAALKKKADEIVEFARNKLSGAKIPKGIVFTNEIPRNPNGKASRSKLAKYYGIQTEVTHPDWEGIRVVTISGWAEHRNDAIKYNSPNNTVSFYNEGIEYPCIESAVLVPVVRKDRELYFLMTVRAGNISFPGQSVFPGGTKSIEESILETAFRETEEELNIPRKKFKIIRELPMQFSASGHLIHPTLVITSIRNLTPERQNKRGLKLNPAEVEDIFLFPVRDLFEPQQGQHSLCKIIAGNEKVGKRPFIHDQYRFTGDNLFGKQISCYVLGATASILTSLRDQYLTISKFNEEIAQRETSRAKTSWIQRYRNPGNSLNLGRI